MSAANSFLPIRVIGYHGTSERAANTIIQLGFRESTKVIMEQASEQPIQLSS